MKFCTRQLAAFGATLLVTVVTLRAESPTQGEAVVRLLNLFAARTDPLAVANAGKLLANDMSPAQVVASDLHLPSPSLGGWNSPETTRLNAKQLGEYVAEHSGDFAGALPSAESIHEPLRLEAFFEGLYFPVLGSSSDHFQKDLARLSSLLDESWLEVAASCGSENLRQLILVQRRELGKVLMSYQESGDETAVIILGEALASWSSAYRQIEPKEFAPRTLALLLAGSLGAPQSDPDENLAIVTTAARWVEVHPILMDMLRDLQDPASLSLLEIRVLWRTDRMESMKRLAAINRNSSWVLAGFIMELFQDAALSASDAVPLIKLLPGKTLEAWLKRSKPGDIQGRQAQIDQWINAELNSRNPSAEAPR